MPFDSTLLFLYHNCRFSDFIFRTNFLPSPDQCIYEYIRPMHSMTVSRSFNFIWWYNRIKFIIKDVLFTWAEVKNEWRYTCIPSICIRCAFVGWTRITLPYTFFRLYMKIVMYRVGSGYNVSVYATFRILRQIFCSTNCNVHSRVRL